VASTETYSVLPGSWFGCSFPYCLARGIRSLLIIPLFLGASYLDKQCRHSKLSWAVVRGFEGDNIIQLPRFSSFIQAEQSCA
jgi:hypothetical protein